MFGYFFIQDTVPAVLPKPSMVIIISANYDFLTKQTNKGPVSSADRLAQFEEHRTAAREVAGSNLGRTNTQGL